MMRKAAAVIYWLAATVIALGAIGHGFGGVRPVRAAIEASTLPDDVVRVIWIVWYWVSGCMVVLGALLFLAWPGLKAGSSRWSALALIIGVFYLITGIVAFLYSGREPFWILFVTLGVMVIGSTLALSRST
jgi:hypothetical protein